MAGEKPTLFPCTSTPVPSLFPCTSTPVPSLFPCVKENPNYEKSNQSTDNLSWLQNSSFPESLIPDIAGSSTEKPIRSYVPDTRTQGYDKPSKKSHKDHKKVKKDKKKKSKHKKKKVKEEIGEEGLFEIARERDKNNLTYGGLYKFDIPVYKVYWKQYVGEDKSHFLKRCPISASDWRYYTSIQGIQECLEHSTSYTLYPHSSSYIPLQSSSVHWLHVKPVKKVTTVTNAVTTVMDKEKFSSNDPTKSDPYDLDLWLEFINNTDTTKAGLERRHAIIDRALKYIPSNNALLDLKIKTCSLYMSSQNVGKMWTDILFHQPNNLELWIKYLVYKENTLSEFSFTTVIASYRKCMKTLLGFKDGTFKSHKYEGDIDHALITITTKLGDFLLHVGHSEKAVTLFTVLIELNFRIDTGKSLKTLLEEEFSDYWESRLSRLGDGNYSDWFNSSDSSYRHEIDTEIMQGEDVWNAWLREEEKKSKCSWRPVNTDEEIMDLNSRVSLNWVKPFIFYCNSLDILVGYFKVFLPLEYKTVPLWSLQFCDLCIEKLKAEYICNIMKQVYERFTTEDQSTVGYMWFLAAKTLKTGKSGKFIKSLLKHSAHRNNLTYWTLFLSQTPPEQQLQILQTLVKSVHDKEDKLSLNIILVKVLILSDKKDMALAVLLDGDNVLNCIAKLKRELEEIKCTTKNKSLHGSYLVSVYCRLHILRLLTDTYNVESLVDFIRRLENDKDSLFVLFQTLLEFEKTSRSVSASLKTISILAVEMFPQLHHFWSTLSQCVQLSGKVWQRLSSEYSWYERITMECSKDTSNPDINLSHRILSLCGQCVDKFPHSVKLWELYLACAQKYNPGIVSSVVVRAVKNNPSHKQLYVSGIRLCEEERSSIYDLMEEKEVRIRVLLEEAEMFVEEVPLEEAEMFVEEVERPLTFYN